ncbi:hypothetical protein IMY05_013G0025000 [Salix suchowensis]|nr:hypothetical protein IMY05_013G0025000 [Salix suchowensis]
MKQTKPESERNTRQSTSSCCFQSEVLDLASKRASSAERKEEYLEFALPLDRTQNYQKKIKIITSLLWAHGGLPKGMM